MFKYIYLLLVATSMVACSKSDVRLYATDVVDLPETIELSFEDRAGDTRVRIDEYDYTTRWCQGDAVSVFYRNPNNLKWEFTGSTGAMQASLNYVSGDVGGQTSELITIVYPYNEDATVSNTCKTVYTTLSDKQIYAQASYALNGNIMVASGLGQRFKLRSVCGWLRITFVDEGKSVSSITLRGNNGEIIAGDIVVDANTAEYAVRDGGHSMNRIILDCGDGVELQKSPTHFYIGLLPQNFSKGITVEVEYTDGTDIELSTTTAMTIARNHIVPMECINSDGDPISSSVPNNQIWYSATAYVDFEAYDYGDVSVISNTFDELKGTGVVEFSSDLKSITGSCSSTANLVSLIFPKSLQYIGNNTFINSSQLTTIVLNDGLQTIGDQAFAYCSSLRQVHIPESVVEIGVNPFVRCDNLSEFMGAHTSKDGHCLIIDGRLVALSTKVSKVYTIPNSVKTIGSYCFVNTTNVEELILPSGLDYIYDNAFNIYTFDHYIVRCNSKTPPEIGSQAFSNCAEIYVPIDCFEEYMSTTWNNYILYAYDSVTGETKSNWISMGECLFRDDIIAPLYGLDEAYIMAAELRQKTSDPNRYRIHAPFTKEKFLLYWGDVPTDMIFYDNGFIEFIIYDNGDVEIPSSWLGFSIYWGGEYEPMYMASYTYYGDRYGKYEDGIIRFETEGSLFWHHSDGSGMFSNSRNLFAIAFPGYELSE